MKDSLKGKKNFLNLPLRDCYEDDYDIQIAVNIVKLRIDRGITQAQLAKKLKTKQSAIARMESGNRPVSHKMLKKIARALNAIVLAPSFKDLE